MERFVNVAKVDQVKRGKGKLVLVADLTVAVLNSDGAFYAIEDFVLLTAPRYRMDC